METVPPVQQIPSVDNTATDQLNQEKIVENPSFDPPKYIFFILAAIVIILICVLLFFLRKRTETIRNVSINPLRETSSTVEPIAQNRFSEVLNPITTHLGVLNIPFASLEGQLFFYKNAQSLGVSNSNGENQTTLIESKNILGFAGWSSGGKAFYYSELVGTLGTLYKVDLVSRKETKLFSFTSTGKSQDNFKSDVAVRKDEKYAVYIHNDNLFLYDFINKSVRPLLGDCPTKPNTPLCSSYMDPHWSPIGDYINVRKTSSGIASQVIVAPFFYPPHEQDTKIDGTETQWGNENEMFIFSGKGLGGGLYRISNPANSIETDIVSNTQEFKDTIIYSGVVSPDERIAFSYVKSDTKKFGIAEYNRKDKSINTLFDIPNEKYIVQDWVPESNILFYIDDQHTIWSFDTKNSTKKKLPIQVTSLIGIVR